MAPNKCVKAAVVLFTFVFLFVGLSVSVHSPQGQKSRVRRQACEEYNHEGRTCCKCGAGFKRMEHCSAQKNDTKCDLCEDGTFSSIPNSLKNCDLCRTCSQPGANLEVDIPCKATRDTVCKCKDHHYCISGTHPCKECSPCKECAPGVGVKVKCSPTSDTICNETNKPQGNNALGITLGILIPLFAIAVAVGVFFYIRRKEYCGKERITSNGERQDVEMQPLNVVPDLTPFIPKLASVIGWKDMRNIAMASGMPDGTIESVELDHRQDSQEQTIQLLRKWAEKEGSEASNKLIQYLKEKTGKLEKVREILRVDNSTSSHLPV